MRVTSPYALGATMYMPATRNDIGDIIAGHKLSGLRSIVLCLEDAVREDDVEMGLANLQSVLKVIERTDTSGPGPLVFVRPRHLEMAQIMATWPGIEQVDGFVAPKVRPGNVEAWVRAVSGTNLLLMPTLETAEMFDAVAVRDFRDELLGTDPKRMLALRIGGNDLMACLGLRRDRGRTLYEGPLLYTVSMLVGILAPAGFHMTSPVCEVIDDPETLMREVERDIAFGLVGKTAIHPDQIETIQSAFRVSASDHEAARKILADDAAAVFKLNGAMCEPSTHRAWADRIMERAKYYGYVDGLQLASSQAA